MGNFDPRSFILPPYWACPACGREGCYGVLMVVGNGYRRRCRECWHSDHYSLPAVLKAVIYLDQMVISEMTKALHPVAGAARDVDPFWKELFERLDVLCRMQLAICPDSPAHRAESAVWRHPEALRRMYEHFSHGTSFLEVSEVREAQLMEFVANWARGRPEQSIDVGLQSVIRGHVHVWQERFYFSVSGFDAEDWPERLRESRDRTGDSLASLSERRRSEGNFNFDDVYRKELHAIGETTIALHIRSTREMAEMQAGVRAFDPEAFMPTNATSTVRGIQHRLREAGVDEDDVWPKTAELFQSEHLDQIPYLRISAMLFAAMARKAWAGQRRNPGGGAITDVTTVAAVLPVCDAIFVDREVAALLNEEPLRTRIDFGTKVFSSRTRDRFIEYLDDLREAASDEHVAAVHEVYGDSYLRPSSAIFGPR